jgi:hypothetical protein
MLLHWRTNSFFWFGQPGLIISLLQLLQFLLAVSVAMLIEFGAKLKTDTELGVSIVMVGAALIVYTITLPRVIPAYTMVGHSMYSNPTIPPLHSACVSCVVSALKLCSVVLCLRRALLSFGYVLCCADL